MLDSDKLLQRLYLSLEIGGGLVLKKKHQNTFNTFFFHLLPFQQLLSNHPIFIGLIYFFSTNTRKQFVYTDEIGIIRLYGCHIASDLQLSRYISRSNLFLPPISMSHTHRHTHTKSKSLLKESGEMVSSQTIISVQGDQYQRPIKKQSHQNSPIKNTLQQLFIFGAKNRPRGSLCSYRMGNMHKTCSTVCGGASVYIFCIQLLN